MEPDVPDILWRVAESIADGEDIDWSALDPESTRLDDRLEYMRQIHQVAGSFRESLLDDPSAPEAGASDSHPPPEPSPERWGPLQIRERLGEGTRGFVYRAFDPLLEREVALKLWKTSAGEVDRVAALIEEAKRLARVRHPGVVVVLGADVHDGVPGIWTERLGGESLSAYLAREGACDPERAARMCADLCKAVAAVHAARLVHGDIKDENVQIESDGRIVLLDFGSGRDIDRREPADVISATPLFTAPEVLRGEATSVASDLYSIGVVLFRLLTGRFPVEARTWDELMDAHRSRGSLPSHGSGVSDRLSQSRRLPCTSLPIDVPPALIRVVERSLAFLPGDRYQSAEEMSHALELASSVLEAQSHAGTNLPQRSTRFFGRSRLLEELRGKLSERRFVTVIGPGGAGKTRLAIEGCRVLVPKFRDGVWWIDLSLVSSDSSIPSAILGATGIQPGKRGPRDALFHSLRARCMLLILDNAEHLAAATGELCESILRASPETQILVTSRVPLDSPLEDCVRVPPLETPSAPELPGTDVPPADREDSVRLFIDRARGKDPEFEQQPWGPEVDEICRALEGLPLAIEIAAARVTVFTPREIADRITDPLFLSDSTASRPHHRSVQASVEWSVSLLPESARSLFRLLAVFSGGWSRAAAVAVSARPEFEVSLDLGTLVNHSLVERDRTDGGAIRVHFLEPVREIASQSLRETQDAGELAKRHWDYFHSRFEDGSEEMTGPRFRTVLADLLPDRANLDRALEWARDCGKSDAGLLRDFAWLVARLHRFWMVSGAREVGVRYVSEALECIPEHEEPRLVGWLYLTSARLRIVTSFPQSAEHVQTAIRLLHAADDPEGLGHALLVMSSVDIVELRFEEARGRIQEAEAAFQRAGLPDAQRWVLVRRAVLAIESRRPDAADADLAEAERSIRAVGDPLELGHLLATRAALAWGRQDLARARELFEQSLVQYRGISDDIAVSLLHTNLSTTLCHLGLREDGRVHLDLAMQIARRSGNDWQAAHCSTASVLEFGGADRRERLVDAMNLFYRESDPRRALSALRALAMVELEDGDAPRAVTIHAAVDRIGAQVGIVLDAKLEGEREAAWARLEDALDPEALVAAREMGKGWSLEALMSFAAGAASS